MAAWDERRRDDVKRSLLSVYPEIETPQDQAWFSVVHGTARLVVSFATTIHGVNLIQIWGITNAVVKPSDELYSIIARTEAPLGAPSVKLQEDGTADVVFSYALPDPASFDRQQFLAALSLVAGSADQLDDLIQAQFGGRIAIDPLDRVEAATLPGGRAERS